MFEYFHEQLDKIVFEIKNKNVSKDYFARGCNVTLTNLK